MPEPMSSLQTVTVERDDDLLWITLNDPGRANALSPRMIEEITEIYQQPWREEGIRSLLLQGVGKHFSAGADLSHLESLRDASLDDNREDSRRLRNLFAAILDQGALTLALVQGACVAGGCGVATAHDFVLAARGARFMYSEVKIGFVAALVASFLPLRLRGREIREILLNPRFLDSERALEIGLIDRVVARDELREAGRALALEILTNASSESIARTKHLLLDRIGRPLPEALDRAAETNARARLTEDCRRGISHFLEHKEPPEWR